MHISVHLTFHSDQTCVTSTEWKKINDAQPPEVPSATPATLSGSYLLEGNYHSLVSLVGFAWFWNSYNEIIQFVLFCVWLQEVITFCMETSICAKNDSWLTITFSKFLCHYVSRAWSLQKIWKVRKDNRTFIFLSLKDSHFDVLPTSILSMHSLTNRCIHGLFMEHPQYVGTMWGTRKTTKNTRFYIVERFVNFYTSCFHLKL